MGRLTIERPHIIPTVILNSDDPSANHFGTANFRPQAAQEGHRIATLPRRETALSVAFQAADDRKNKKRQEDKARRKAALEQRLETLRNKPAGEKSKPAPQRPKWETDQPDYHTPPSSMEVLAMSRALAAPPTPTRREPIRQTMPAPRQVTRPVTSQPVASAAPPRFVEPSISPPARDDPRVINGTLAPSPRVAEVLKTTVAAPPVVQSERPLQTSSAPDEFARIKESGSPRQILAGRKPKDLTGSDREAYCRAVERLCRADGILRKPRRARRGADRYTPFGITVTEYRIARGMTLHVLADLCGSTASTISKPFKDPAAVLPVQTVHRLADALEISPDVLLKLVPTYDAPDPLAILAGRGMKDLSPDELSEFRAALGKASGAARMVRAAIETKAKRAPVAVAEPEPVARWKTPREVMAGRPLGKLTADELHEYHIALGKASVAVRAERAAARVKARVEREAAAAAPKRRGRPPKPKPADVAPVAASGVAGMFPLPAAPLSAKAKYGIETAADPVEPVGTITHIEKPDLAVHAPRPPIEKGIPVPGFFLSRDMFRFDEMDKGDSFLAEVPHGMTFEDFRTRFAAMVGNVQKKSRHWYITEEAADRSGIRCWRVI